MTTSRSRRATGALALCAAFLLGACGGGDAAAPEAADAPRRAALAVVEGWVPVTVEGQAFAIGGTQVVRYGAGANWVRKTVTGRGLCSNSYFGSDPLYGTVKSCQLGVAVPDTGGWARVAAEGQSFTVDGPVTVRYGVDTRWRSLTVDGTAACSNAFFGGDPAYGVVKGCEVYVAPATGDTQPPSVALTGPANLASGLTGLLAIGATASDNVGVASVEFQVDGAAVGTDTAAPYTASVDTGLYAAGQHVVRARARDGAGNTSGWASATVQFGGSRTQPAGFTRNDAWVSGLASATAFAQAPDGRLFVAQQGGQLRIVKNGVLLAAPFLNLTVDSSGERGVIGVVLHPNFASNRWVYVYHTTPENGAHNRISRFTASGTNPDVVASGSEVHVVDLPPLTATNHNGGAMHFGTDGKLYVAVGDNANSALAPDLSQPFGKLLRFNDDGGIPSDNPFCTTAGQLRCAIWARGLRNPYTFAVRASDGRIHVNDVGESTWEEVNLGVRGANYGWPTTEGPTTASGITGPLFAYDHDAGPSPGGFFSGCAIVGGAFYPTSGAFPAAYRGSYYFTDFCSRVVGRVDLANGNAAYAFGAVSGSPVDLLAGLDGALYVLTRGSIVRFSAP